MGKRSKEVRAARVESLAAQLHELVVEERTLVRLLVRVREAKAVAVDVIARAARKAR